MELCVNALGSCLPCDVITKSLIYKTIASLLPNDLEVCRACALLVFFVERTVEAYKIVYLLYMHPDQEYHVELSPIRNHVRFETLQVETFFITLTLITEKKLSQADHMSNKKQLLLVSCIS